MSLDVSKLLTELGLSAHETSVYLAGLKTGPTSIQELAKLAKISRTAAYDIMNSLQNKGLFSTFERGKKKLFAAEAPESLVTHFKGQMFKMGEKLTYLEKSLPEVALLVGGERPTVRIFEGDDAVLSVYRDFSQLRPKELRELANLKDVSSIDPTLLAEAKKMLNDESCKFKVLYIGDVVAPKPGREICRLPEEFGEFHGDLWIYGNRVVFVTFLGKVTTVIIESQVFADMARILFDAAWEVCRVINHDSHKIT